MMNGSHNGNGTVSAPIFFCPKYRMTMRTVGVKVLGELVQVERCAACGAVLLDRGELEKLIALDRKLQALLNETPLEID